VRLFAAVVPPDHVTEHLDDFLSVRREAGEFRWTVPEQWHLTLAFMPAVADRHLDDLLERLGRAGHRRRPFDLRIEGGGAFPDPARAKVLFAGLETEGRTELQRLATGARAAGTRAGAEVDGGRFRPHLTLARVRRPHDVTKWIRLLEGYAGPEWTVDEFALIESHLGEGPRKRPRHDVVQTFPLG
jgi:RNA 2',3'-cyclic 3'-phosphodiesterase